jgi:hypothetical protein
LEERKFTSYSKLNKKEILAPTIPSGFVTSKLALNAKTNKVTFEENITQLIKRDQYRNTN